MQLRLYPVNVSGELRIAMCFVCVYMCIHTCMYV